MLYPTTTERLILRRPQPEDVQAFFDMFSDEQTCRMDGGYPPYASLEAAARDMQAILATSGDRLFIDEVASGRLIGLLHVMPADDPAALEIGYVIHRDFRRRGYAREAVLALLTQLKGDGIRRVRATCYRFNDASAALLRSLGFTEAESIPNPKNPEYSMRCFFLTLQGGCE